MSQNRSHQETRDRIIAHVDQRSDVSSTYATVAYQLSLSIERL
jgi:hypothetical protein